jgi:hypothetical protein
MPEAGIFFIGIYCTQDQSDIIAQLIVPEGIDILDDDDTIINDRQFKFNSSKEDDKKYHIKLSSHDINQIKKFEISVKYKARKVAPVDWKPHSVQVTPEKPLIYQIGMHTMYHSDQIHSGLNVEVSAKSSWRLNTFNQRMWVSELRLPLFYSYASSTTLSTHVTLFTTQNQKALGISAGLFGQYAYFKNRTDALGFYVGPQTVFTYKIQQVYEWTLALAALSTQGKGFNNMDGTGSFLYNTLSLNSKLKCALELRVEELAIQMDRPNPLFYTKASIGLLARLP